MLNLSLVDEVDCSFEYKNVGVFHCAHNVEFDSLKYMRVVVFCGIHNVEFDFIKYMRVVNHLTNSIRIICTQRDLRSRPPTKQGTKTGV